MPKINSSKKMNASTARPRVTRQNRDMDFATRYSRMKELLEKKIAKRISSSYVPDETLKAAITL